ncbi:hypothetical protein HYH03_005166 [Edaphochlamys debaryana]|uniref:Protein kinase domain-containing protein n=1 Tax=Edaphochlamys debaryana TaxID=47281 RepID=A0A835Y5K0_9CHLO|nr:hypothetical protein HYH03_005166 [Edaphochlamys debaryana]|eukprot:KAG2496757.1 hypothetical protein HYH03_005166 [Edaphochlamys debaryana]
MRGRALALLAGVILSSALHAGAQTQQNEDLSAPTLFSVGGEPYALYLQSLPYDQAVAACASSVLLPGRAALLPAAMLSQAMSRFRAEQPATATALLKSLAEAAAAGGAVQERWALWLWDEYHPCVAARYMPGRDTALGGDTWVVIDRPCAWKLAFVCAREQTVLAAGRTSSSAWHQTFLASPATSVLQPSPYAAGPQDSGLELTTSGLVIGDPNPSADVTLPFNDASLFWSRGPVVSALFRAGSGKLLGLKLLREADVEGAWAQYQNQSRGVPGVFGSANPGFDLGPSYELYNVGPYNDYVIAVEGCFRGWEVETLVLVTRTGRQLQLGRGGCTHRFREDAPPGGYLAGVEGRSLDPAVVEAAGEMLGLGRTQVAWIRQVKLVWSAPSGAGPPAVSVVEAPRPREAYEPCPEGSFAGCFTPCPGGGYRNESRISAPTVNDFVSSASVRPSVNTPASAVFMVKTDGTLSYSAAVSYCASLTHLGLTWALVPSQDVLGYGNGSITEIPAQSAIQHRISAISLSHAVQASNTTDPVTVLTALALRWEGEGAPEPAVAGDVSTGGWETLELEAGETVTSVSGCAGGFVERLAVRTSLGRVWTPAFLASSLCSAPFSLDAPARGYLVGFQTSHGQYLEWGRLIWGTPQQAAEAGTGGLKDSPAQLQPSVPSEPAAPPLPVGSAKPAPSSLVAAEQAASSGDSGGDDNSATIAAAVGGSVAGVVVIAAALAVVLVRRRRANKAAAKSVEPNLDSDSLEHVRESAGTGSGGSGPDVESNAWSSLELGGPAGQGHSDLKTACVAGSTPLGSNRTLGPGDTQAPDLVTGPEPAPSPDPFLSTASHIVDVESKLASYIRVLHETHGQMMAEAATEGGAGGMASHENTTSPELGTALRQTEAELARFQDQARITCVIGQGASGVVYLGSWRGLRVAVKTLVVHDALLGAQGRLRQRAILEAAISKAMHHPNVVATYAAEVLPLTALAAGKAPAAPTGSEGGDGGEQCDVFKLFIIQEFCDVGSLRSCIDATAVGSVAGGGASALCALSLAMDVACGMAHIHSQNIVHGDLSAGNVLLSSNTASEGAIGGAEGSALHPLRGLWRPPVVAKVADFGLSVHMGDGQTHASNRFQGTPLYTAPEVLLRGHLSPAADVWSYGVLLLELCHGEGIARVRARVGPGAGPATPTAQGAPPPPILQWAAPSPSTPPLLMQLLASCFAPEPSRRPTFAQVCEVLIEVLRLEHGRCSQGAAEPGRA